MAHLVFARTAAEVGPDGLRASAVFVWNFRSTLVPELIASMPNLQWVHVAGVGVDASLSDEVRRREVVVTNARGVTAQAMAEYALALMLHFAKDLGTTLEDQRRGAWNPRLSKNLAGACLVTVGVGAVNRTLATMVRAIGMRVIGVGRTAHAGAFPYEKVVGHLDLETVLPEADYVVLAAPLTDETRGLIGARELAFMKPSAVVINIGRGAVIEEAPLIHALAERRIGGAALDVVWREPLEVTHPLWTMPHVVLSPHMSSDAIGWQEAMVDRFVANLGHWVRGEPLENVVDNDLGYVPSETPTPAGSRP